MQTIISSDINKASELLKNGHLVAIPTETVYGLAGNALNENVILKIFETKNRPAFDPLIIHVPSLQAACDYVTSIPEVYHTLAKRFSPGPLTYICQKSNLVPDLLSSGLPTVAIRIPDHPKTLELLKQLPFPLAAPSANLFGRISPTNPSHVKEQLDGKISMILNGGPCKLGVESTIVTFNDNELQVLRQGSTSMEAINEVFNKVTCAGKPGFISAPGQLKSHYAPGTPLYFGSVDKYLEKFRGKRIGVISFSKDYGLQASVQQILSANKDLNEAARKLFAAMHELENLTLDVILAEEFPEKGLGRAINDRLRRASVNCQE